MIPIRRSSASYQMCAFFQLVFNLSKNTINVIMLDSDGGGNELVL